MAQTLAQIMAQILAQILAQTLAQTLAQSLAGAALGGGGGLYYHMLARPMFDRVRMALSIWAHVLHPGVWPAMQYMIYGLQCIVVWGIFFAICAA